MRRLINVGDAITVADNNTAVNNYIYFVIRIE